MKALKSLLFFTLIYIWLPAQAQITQNIKGTVIDKESEFPLPGAEIQVTSADKKYGAVTDFNGEYFIHNVPIGKINIEVKFVITIHKVRII